MARSDNGQWREEREGGKGKLRGQSDEMTAFVNWSLYDDFSLFSQFYTSEFHPKVSYKWVYYYGVNNLICKIRIFLFYLINISFSLSYISCIAAEFLGDKKQLYIIKF